LLIITVKIQGNGHARYILTVSMFQHESV